MGDRWGKGEGDGESERGRGGGGIEGGGERGGRES